MNMHLLVTIKAVEEKPIWAGDKHPFAKNADAIPGRLDDVVK